MWLSVGTLSLLLGLVSCGPPAAPVPAPSAPPTDRTAAPDSLGPMVGSPSTVGRPRAGRHAAQVHFRQHVFHTRERDTTSDVAGSIWLDLAGDGAASTCFAIRSTERTSVSRYESPDGQDHSDSYADDIVEGWVGTWTLDGGVARIRLTRSVRGSCALDTATAADPDVELRCVRLDPNAVLPTPTMACEVVSEHRWLRSLAVDTGPRATPFAFLDPMEPPNATATPWLLLSSAGDGLELQARRSRGSEPFALTVRTAAAPARPEQHHPEPR